MKQATCKFLLLTLFVCFGLTAYAAKSNNNKVSITLVADQGVVIKSGEISILLDGCDRSIYQDLLKAKPPFSSIQLVLISHPHVDHFSPDITRDFLNNHPEAQLLSSADIIKKIKQRAIEYPQIQKQLKEVSIEKDWINLLELSGVKGKAIESKHAVSPLFPESVMGYMFHIGDKKIVYFGESEMMPDSWQNRDMKSQHIDMVVLPYWIYKEETTQQVLREYIAPKKIVVTLEANNRKDDQFAELFRKNMEVTFMDTIMQSIELE